MQVEEYLQEIADEEKHNLFNALTDIQYFVDDYNRDNPIWSRLEVTFKYNGEVLYQVKK